MHKKINFSNINRIDKLFIFGISTNINQFHTPNCKRLEKIICLYKSGKVKIMQKISYLEFKLLLFSVFILSYGNIIGQTITNDTVPVDTVVHVFNDGKTLKINQQDVIKSPFSELTSFSMMAAGATKYKEEDVYFYGFNTSGKSAYVNGIFIEDASSFPKRVIEEMNIYTGFQPISQNLTYGIKTTINTILPDSLTVLGEISGNMAKNLSAGTGEIMINLPLWKAKENRKAPSLMIAGTFTTTNNNDPVWRDTKKLSDEKLTWLIENPVVKDPIYLSLNYNSNYITENDLVDMGTMENNGSYSYNPLVMLNIPVNENISLSVGSYASIKESDIYSAENYLLNSKNFLVENTQNFDNFLNLSHTFVSKSDLKVSYNLSAQYSNYYTKKSNPNLGDDYFAFGYVGSFTSYMTPTYELGSDTVDGHYYENVWLLNSWNYDTLVTFNPGTANPDLSYYTSEYYRIYNDSPSMYQNLSTISLHGGIINGGSLPSVYGLYNNYGDVNTSVGEWRNEKIRAALEFNINYKNHNITVGGEYNRDKRSYYSINPTNIWSLMGAVTNFHLMELDLDNPILVNNDGHTDTIIYNRLYDGSVQYEFDKNLRKALGLPVDGLDYILIDSYDMENNTISYYDEHGVMHTISTPENLLSLDMYSPKTLLFSNLDYKGYDYTGNENSPKDPYSYYTDYTISADEPQYGSFYLQDEFNYKNLKIKAGLRFDFYDANRPVLKDKHTLYPAYNVKEALELGEFEMNVPGNIGDNYVVYVNKYNDPTQVTGYRDGDTWYNAEGIEIYDPDALDQGNGVTPYLKDPSILSMFNPNWTPDMTFKDYGTVVNVLPQLSLDYTFFKKYNLHLTHNSFTSNPVDVNAWLPYQYQDPLTGSFYTGLLTNPDLKPIIGSRTMFGASAFLWNCIVANLSYLVNRIDNIYIINEIDAFPTSYYLVDNSPQTYSIPGFEIRVNLLENLIKGLSTEVSYTRLFDNDEEIIANNVSGELINAKACYDFGTQNLFNTRIFNGFSVSLFYQHRKGTKFAYINDNIPTGKYGYTPDVNTCNLNITKEIIIGRKAKLDIYLTIENLFNYKIVYDVYAETGNFEDDGFLFDPANQRYINNQLSPESFRALYQLNLYNTSFYGIPRLWNFGLVFRY